MSKYMAMFKSPLNVKDFKFTKLLKERIKHTKHKSPLSRLARADAVQSIHDDLASMDKNSVYYEELTLEIEYIREVEKERLRINIKNALGLDFIGGDCTLAEIGKVLNLTRERCRQIEDQTVKRIRRPLIARKIRCFL